MTRAYPREGLAETFLIERFEQVIDRAYLKGLERVGVIRSHEHQGGQLRRFQGAREVDAVERIHLYIEKQDLRLLLAHCGERGVAVAEFPDDAQILLRLAKLAQ